MPAYEGRGTNGGGGGGGLGLLGTEKPGCWATSDPVSLCSPLGA